MSTPTSPITPLVQIDSVEKIFHRGSEDVHVLADLNLTIPTGEFLALMGPSGSGKSTLLRCINHLEKIDGGRLTVDGELIGYRQRGDKI